MSEIEWIGTVRIWWGFMSRNGLEGRRRGSILVQLGATAGVLVLPPLMMSAGVTLFGSQTEDRLQIAADQSLVSAVSTLTKTSALAPLPGATRVAVKSAERPPLLEERKIEGRRSEERKSEEWKSEERKSDLQPRTVTETAPEPEKSTEEPQPAEAMEPAPFLGPVPVTLVVVRKEPEPAPEPEPEEEPAPPVASIAPVVVPRAPSKPSGIHAAHPRIKSSHEGGRAQRRTAEKRPHAASQRAASASAPSKAKPKASLQRRADLEN